METVRLRWMAEQLGFEKLTLKNEKLKGYFVSSDRKEYFNSEAFGNILSYVQTHPKKCRLTEHKNRPILTIDEVLTVEDAKSLLSKMIPNTQLQA